MQNPNQQPSVPSTDANSAPVAKQPRTKAGFIDQNLETDIQLATDCFREAAQPAIAAALVPRDWLPAQQTELGASLGRCGAFVLKIQEARTGTGSGSEAEAAAHDVLVIALDPIIKGVRRTHAGGTAERAAYGIGKGISGVSTQDLLRYAIYAASQLAPGDGGAPAKDTLKGVLPAEIAAIKTLAEEYRNADWAHGDAQKSATELLGFLRKEVREVLNKLRRDLQGAADQAFTHRDPANAAQRQAFGLQPDQPIRD